ncbi:MAG: hypothetical protein AAGF56_03305, partial [Pseudomonadota bacterium]
QHPQSGQPLPHWHTVSFSLIFLPIAPSVARSFAHLHAYFSSGASESVIKALWISPHSDTNQHLSTQHWDFKKQLESPDFVLLKRLQRKCLRQHSDATARLIAL